MRNWILSALLIAWFTGCLSCASRDEAGKTQDRPNFILIMADDLGYGDIGCYGNREALTPNLDSLAARGLRFTDYHSNGAVCSPTRAALMTGRYQQRAGLEGVIYVGGETRQTGLDTSEVTMAEVLKEAGYRTAIYGKWHLGYRKEYNPVHHGFDDFRGFLSGNIDYISHYDNAVIYDWWHNLDTLVEEGYATDLITRHAADFIDRNRDHPFFLYVAHAAPHWPYQGREDRADRIPGAEHDPRGSRADREAAYREMVGIMDHGIGRILDRVRENGLEENTFIFFCSDNGGVPVLGNNGALRAHKGTLWEGGHRVPAIAYWKGRIDTGVSHQTVISMDLFPTLASLAGIPGSRNPGTVLPETDGIDLSGHLLQGEALAGRTVFWRYRDQRAARKGAHKLVVDGKDTLLFDLDSDPTESTDISAGYPQIREELVLELEDWETGMDANYAQKTR